MELLLSVNKLVHVSNIFQITYRDVFDEERTFGPVFNDSHFLLPLLKLQKDIEAIVAEDGTTLQVWYQEN